MLPRSRVSEGCMGVWMGEWKREGSRSGRGGKEERVKERGMYDTGRGIVVMVI